MKKLCLGCIALLLSLIAPHVAAAQVVTRTVTTTTQSAPEPRNEPYCREYTQSFTIGNETQNGYGTACLQPDGSWEIVKPDSDNRMDAVASAPGQTTTETIQYITRDDHVYFVPPRPFLSIGVYGGGYGYRGRGYGYGHGYGGNGFDRHDRWDGHGHR